jgi:predicted RecB family nuclease
MKAYILLCTNEKGKSREYINILENEIYKNRTKYSNKIKTKMLKSENYSSEGMKQGIPILLGVTLSFEDLVIYADAIIRIENISSKRMHNYRPVLVVGTQNISKEQKLQLAFIGYVLSKFQKKKAAFGTIVVKGMKEHNIKLETLYHKIRNILKSLRKWNENTNPIAPPLMLNKNCRICHFQNKCVAKAVEKDDLSLLGGLTNKAIQKYQKKGIFTINQLSYLFRPRKQRKRKKSAKTSSIFKAELQALALRNKKIYVRELPELPNNEVKMFLDIEGIPDQNFYYLIGLLVIKGNKQFFHSFWANCKNDEQQIWHYFIKKASEYPDAPIYHYGAYDFKAIDQLKNRYGNDTIAIEKRLINVNSFIFGKIYFPVKSNSLKDIGLSLGASWTHPESSGLQSLVWRYKWDETIETRYKHLLLTYNEEDCRALHLLTSKLKYIVAKAHSDPNLDFADEPKKYTSDVGNQIHKDFEQMLKFSHARYDKSKISFCSEKMDQNSINEKIDEPKKSYVRIVPRPNKIKKVPRMRKCPSCKKYLKVLERNAEITVTDLVFTKSGYRKTIVKYTGKKTFCNNCRRIYKPKIVNNFHRRKFDHGFMSWVVYQRIILRLPYELIAQTMEDMFNERTSLDTILQFIYYLADFYSQTEKVIIKQILKSPFVHVDETKINIRGESYYVWVFTDGRYVVYKLTENREATIVHEFFSSYSGIVISDFYGGYDSLQCRQQKCWSHFIRDINEELWKEPFNDEFEAFVLNIKNLLVPIFKSIRRFGLKKRHFNKFKPSVGKFYKGNVEQIEYDFEVTRRFQKRFIRYKSSLFTFLEEDGISWNNIMAERAIKPIAIQRKISTIFWEKGASKYLLLLSIAQSCKFQKKSFLKFLISQEKDIEKFRAPKPLKYSRLLQNKYSI